MIYSFEFLTNYEKDFLKGMEPFIDFRYSLKEGCYHWQVHNLVVDGKHTRSLRLHALRNLKKGFICTDFEEAKYLSSLLEGMDDWGNLKVKYDWLEDYLIEQGLGFGINYIALPVGEYIRNFAFDFEMLEKVDFEDLFAFAKRNYGPY
jgi:hypothetical protein